MFCIVNIHELYFNCFYCITVWFLITEKKTDSNDLSHGVINRNNADIWIQ